MNQWSTGNMRLSNLGNSTSNISYTTKSKMLDLNFQEKKMLGKYQIGIYAFFDDKTVKYQLFHFS